MAILIESSANLIIKDNDGYSPLNYAIEQGKLL